MRNAIRNYLESQGFKLLPENYYKDMKIWEQWWEGELDEFHKYKIYNGQTYVPQKRAELNAAKMGAEYWADLLWNEECYFTVDSESQETSLSKRILKKLRRDNDDESQKTIENVFENSNFYSQFNETVEKYCAMGNGAVVVHDNKIEFIDYDNIEILAHNNKIIESCALTSCFSHEKFGQCAYLMIHRKQLDGSYKIQNRFFKISAEGDTLIPFTKDELKKMNVKDEYIKNNKHFFILKPAIANNRKKKSPLGISVYANAIDVLKMIDLALDGIKASMEIGKPRIAVSSEGITTVIGQDGKPSQIPVFDSNDLAFYKFPEGIDSKKIIEDMTTTYRAGDFETSLEKALSLFSMLIGLGPNTFRWENGQIKTATEVISVNSKMFRTMRKHQGIIRSCIITICKAILEDNGKDYDLKIKVEFDDSIVTDKETERTRWQQLYRDEVIPKWLYLVEHEGYSEEEAKNLVEEAKKSSGNNSIADLFGEAGEE